MRVKETGKIVGRQKTPSGTGKDAVALVESSKVRKELPAKMVKKEKYKK
jgi:hypothetical protein